MKKDNILGVVVMGCGLLLALSVFLPYISSFSITISLWDLEDGSRFMYILLGVFVIVLYLINKKTEMAYLTVGYGVFNAITQIISLEGLEGLSVGFYLILLSSLTIGVITFLYDEEKADALIHLSVKVSKSIATQTVYNQSINNNQINSGQAVTQMNTQSITQPLQGVMPQPQVQEQPKPMGFDPMTGQPIYPNQNNN